MVTHSSVLSWRIPRDWGAWWAAVYGVAQSRTQLKWLSSSSSVYMSVSVCQSVPAFFCYLVSIHYFPGGSEGKKSACSTGDLGSIPGSGRSPGEGNGNPLQHTCLENSMDRGSWQATVHGVSKSGTWLSNFTFTFHFHALEQEMATHSSVLAWRIPGTGEPGGLPSMGLHRVGHNWCDLAAAAATLNEVITVNLPLTLEIFWVYWELLVAVTIFFAMILVLM